MKKIEIVVCAYGAKDAFEKFCDLISFLKDHKIRVTSISKYPMIITSDDWVIRIRNSYRMENIRGLRPDYHYGYYGYYGEINDYFSQVGSKRLESFDDILKIICKGEDVNKNELQIY